MMSECTSPPPASRGRMRDAARGSDADVHATSERLLRRIGAAESELSVRLHDGDVVLPFREEPQRLDPALLTGRDDDLDVGSDEREHDRRQIGRRRNGRRTPGRRFDADEIVDAASREQLGDAEPRYAQQERAVRILARQVKAFDRYVGEDPEIDGPLDPAEMQLLERGRGVSE